MGMAVVLLLSGVHVSGFVFVSAHTVPPSACFSFFCVHQAFVEMVRDEQIQEAKRTVADKADRYIQERQWAAKQGLPC